MKEIIDFNGEQWELIPFEELYEYVLEGNTEVLILAANSRDAIYSSIEQITGIVYIDNIHILLKHNGSSICASTSILLPLDKSSWLPYRRINPKNIYEQSFCFCGGPAHNHWCYDTNKVESICYRCKKRKNK